MFPSTAAFLSFSVLFAQLVSAQTFVGCLGTFGLPVGTLPTVPATSQANCNSLCAGNAYSFFNNYNLGCYCGATGPANANIATGATGGGTTGTCQASLFNSQYTASKLGTTFAFQGCMSNVALQQSDAGAPTGSVGSFDTCYNQCKTYRYAIMYPNGGSGSNYNCFCANSPPTVTAAATCTSSTYYVYTHPASAAASGLTRRKELERLEKKRRAQLAISATTFCPEGYDACQISEDAAHGYECLKTDLELESCGGCRFGYFGSYNTTSVIGTDCSTLPRVYPNGVVCQDGTCKIQRCRRGYKLRRGACV